MLWTFRGQWGQVLGYFEFALKILLLSLHSLILPLISPSVTASEDLPSWRDSVVKWCPSYTPPVTSYFLYLLNQLIKNELKHDKFLLLWGVFLVVKICKEGKKMFLWRFLKQNWLSLGRESQSVHSPFSVSERGDICHFGTQGPLHQPFLPILEF